eukprot:CAMPEP_0179239838 /NCGR_PEP_ID=MMETSP0797-20121207/15667_1 /TAXON_ID=47934 /ORGANISM="Dinophysis acuminata, Strain DAEP01" /LENGTH=132 /DNA_ID=CAMNT_0020947173 /DNA_START=326 /DNA_END=722 /DNA_ORIENTATION=-
MILVHCALATPDPKEPDAESASLSSSMVPGSSSMRSRSSSMAPTRSLTCFVWSSAEARVPPGETHFWSPLPSHVAVSPAAGKMPLPRMHGMSNAIVKERSIGRYRRAERLIGPGRLSHHTPDDTRYLPLSLE